MGTLFISLSSRGWRFLSRGDFLMYIRAFCCSWRLLRSGAAQPSTFFMGRLRQCTGITLPSPLAKTGSSGTELILRPFAIAKWRFSSRSNLPMQIEAPAAVGYCFAQGPHTPSTFFMGRLRQCTGITLPSPLAKTGISGTELILRPLGKGRVAFFQPRRSPYADQRTGGRRRLLRSGAAHPKLLFPWDY